MKPIIVTITGPSCAGKSTLENMLETRGFAKAISTTTRAPRTGEKAGVHYYFVPDASFDFAKRNGHFIESVEFGNAKYALSVAEIIRLSSENKPIVVVCDPIGRAQIAEHCEENEWIHIPVFIDNPTEVIAARFLDRLLHETIESGRKALESSSKRLSSIIETEQSWREDAKIGKGYLMRTTFFDESNCDSVVEFISNVCVGLQRLDVKEAA